MDVDIKHTRFAYFYHTGLETDLKSEIEIRTSSAGHIVSAGRVLGVRGVGRYRLLHRRRWELQHSIPGPTDSAVGAPL